MAKRIPILDADGVQMQHNGTPLFVQKLTLGGRSRTTQQSQALLCGDKTISGAELQEAFSKDKGKSLAAKMEQSEVLLSSLFGQAERTNAGLIAECVVNERGGFIFVDDRGIPSLEVAMNIDVDDADLYLAAINKLSPVPINPAANDVEEIAGNSEATTSESSAA